MANITIESVPAVKTVVGANKIPLSQNDNLAHTVTLDTLRKWVASNTPINYKDIINKPTLSEVATSGNYNDLTNKPVLDTEINSISTNGVENRAISEALEMLKNSIPTSNSQLTNDERYVRPITIRYIDGLDIDIRTTEYNHIYVCKDEGVRSLTINEFDVEYQPSYILLATGNTLPHVTLPEEANVFNVGRGTPMLEKGWLYLLKIMKNNIVVYKGIPYGAMPHPTNA